MLNNKQQHEEKYTILTVDDENNIVRSLERLFQHLGYNTLSANSGKEGLALIASQSVDVVVSDMKMPEMDGAQFLEQVAKNNPDIIRIIMTGGSDVESTIRAINKGNIYRYISKPWDDDDLKLTIERALEIKILLQEKKDLLVLTQEQNKRFKELNKGLDKKVTERTSTLEKALSEVASANAELKKVYISTIKTFSALVETKGGPMQGTNQRIAHCAQKLSVKLGAKPEEAQNILVAGLLYSVGKLSLDDELMKKPYDNMNATERTAYLKYPLISEQALKGLEPLKAAANIIRHHLERFDGNGVPDKMADDEIPLGSRILSVVIDFELMKSGLKTGNLPTTSEIIDYLNSNKNKKFDPTIVDEFIMLAKVHLDYVHMF